MQDPWDHIVVYTGHVSESGEDVRTIRVEKDNDEFRLAELQYVGTKLNMRYYADEDGQRIWAKEIAEFDRNQ